MSRRCPMPSIQLASSSAYPLGEGGRHNGSPRVACPAVKRRGSAVVPPPARTIAVTHSLGRLSLLGGTLHASSDDTKALATSFKSPALSWKVRAKLSTSAGGGSSAIKGRGGLAGA